MNEFEILKEKLAERDYYTYINNTFRQININNIIVIEFISGEFNKIKVEIRFMPKTLILNNKHFWYHSRSMSFIVENPEINFDQVLDEIEHKAKAFVGFIEFTEL